VTLQYCMWDFLREIGEEGVGGAEIVKSFSSHEHDGQTVSQTKMMNIARALAWWISKDAASLTIFKPVDFTVVQQQTRRFLEIFFEQLFISSQSTSPLDKAVPTQRFSREPLELVFKKVLKVPALTQGLLFVIPSFFKERARENEFFDWCIDVVKNTLRTGFHDLNLI